MRFVVARSVGPDGCETSALGRGPVAAPDVVAVATAVLALAACGGPAGLDREGQIPAAPGSERRITSHELGQSAPAIDGRRVTWMDVRLERLAGSDVFTRTVDDSLQRLTSDRAEPEGVLALSGDRAVWADRRTVTEGASSNTDIFLADASDPDAGERQLTSDSAPQREPDISGRWVAWTDHRDGNQDIFAYDLTADAEVRITDEEINQFSPTLAGDQLVWLDGRDGGSIRLRNLSTGEGRRLAADIDAAGAVDVAGDHVVWPEQKGEGAEIRLLDISTGDVRTVASGSVRRLNVAVSESLVVWEEIRDETTHLLLVFDIPSGRTMRIPDTRAVPSGLFAFAPDVSGRRVVRVDFRSNNGDIFLFEVDR